MGQPFPIDNRGGAGGNIAGGLAAKARPDGYTLLFATTGTAATNKLMYKDLTFDPQRDFTPVILVGKSPVIIVARPDAPFGSLKELIDYAKANPNKLTAGFPGNGTLGHITGEPACFQARSNATCGPAQSWQPFASAMVSPVRFDSHATQSGRSPRSVRTTRLGARR